MTPKAAHATSPELTDRLAKGIVNEWKEIILVLDQGLQVTFANQSFCDWMDTPWKGIVGRPLRDLLAGPDISDFLCNVLNGSAVRNLQANCNIAEIGKRALLLSANLLLNSDRPAILLGISDITNRPLSNGALTRKVEVADEIDAERAVKMFNG